MFDYHVHTTFSPDAQSPMEEVVISAIEKGLTEICFTDHIDYDWDGKGSDISFNFKEYFKAPSTSGEDVVLSGFENKKKVVLFFYPKDNTPG